MEAAGVGLDGRHAATLTLGSRGVLHGAMSYLQQDADGQVGLAQSISAGLDIPGVGKVSLPGARAARAAATTLPNGWKLPA